MKKSLVLFSAIAVLGLSACSNANEEPEGYEPSFTQEAEADNTAEETTEDAASSEDDSAEEETDERTTTEAKEEEFTEVDASEFMVSDYAGLFLMDNDGYCFFKTQPGEESCDLPFADPPVVDSAGGPMAADSVYFNGGDFEYRAKMTSGLPMGGADVDEPKYFEPGTKTEIYGVEVSYSKDRVLRLKSDTEEFVFYPDGRSEIN
ncbi:hypothetical protein [Corynebacterium camporealensis]